MLGGNYPAYTDSRLISPQISLPSVSGDERILLRFWQQLSYSSYDYAYVQVSFYDPDTAQWSEWAQLGERLEAGDVSPVWSYRMDDLTAYAGKVVKFAWYHSAPYESTGWYINEVTILEKIPSVSNPEGFDGGWGDWSATRGLWEVGTPTAGPPACHGGSQCAGTVLDGNYAAYTDSRFMTPPIRLRDEPNISLNFWHWFSFSSYDAGFEL
ncbi:MULTISPECIES: choice-of-anchor J domain-containing protein [unclassified Thiocapsa]|uniref:choice-of-anchor J domain-containing protein n=1 Tax=unclassified Thiocapsa TaxID=2641286 RepID=UPI0035B4AE44